MVQNIAPTSEFLTSVLWLGTTTELGIGTPEGSGVVVRYGDEQFLATAFHVAEACRFQPLVRRQGAWRRANWETVGVNESADVAVLRTSAGDLSPLDARYGFADVIIGAVGRAIGFPAITDQAEISHFAEIDGLPVPLTTLVSSYFRAGPEASTGIHYAGGYINSGFSGGAMLLPTRDGGWTFGGIITHREGVSRRSISRRDQETCRFELDPNLSVNEPSGLIRYAGIGNVTNLIECDRP